MKERKETWITGEQIEIYKQIENKAIIKKGNKYAVVFFTDSQCLALDYYDKDGKIYYSNNIGQSGMNYVADWVCKSTAYKRLKEITE